MNASMYAFPALCKKTCGKSNTPAALCTPGVQIIVSMCHSPLKGTGLPREISNSGVGAGIENEPGSLVSESKEAL